MPKALEILTIERAPEGQEPKAALIFLHGLGANGYQFESLPGELALSTPARYLFPHAPLRRVTMNHGLPANSWFDFAKIDTQLEEGRDFNLEEFKQSVTAIHEIIDQQISEGIPRSRIVLGGFSQGGIVAYHTALSLPFSIGAVVSLGSFLPLLDRVDPRPESKDTPFFIAHGEADEVVPSYLGQDAATGLSALGYSVKYKAYRGLEHRFDHPALLMDLSEFLGERLS